MAITFDNKKRLFHLFNKNISYYFYINDKDILQHIYFGKYLGSADFLDYLDLGFDWSHTYFDVKERKEQVYSDPFYNSKSFFEVAPQNCGDKRGSCFIIKDEQNFNLTDFRYVSHQISKGKPSLEGLPSFRGSEKEVESVEILLKNIVSDVYLTLTYSIFNNKNIILRNSIITNNSQGNIRIERANSIELDLPSSEYYLTHFYGDWSYERMMCKEKLENGLKRIASNCGRSSHEENPFIMLSEPHTTENSGEALGFSFVYSGNFTIDVNVDKFKSTRILVGINDEDFSYLLKPSESFFCPEGIIGYSENGYGDLSRTFHDVIRENLINPKFVNSPRWLLLNSWEGCFMDFDTQKILDFIDAAYKIGAELFVLDDGWFGDRNDDSSSLGDWDVNTDKVDLNRVITKCHNFGMKFGIWFEPEMINPNSNLYRINKDYALGRNDIDIELSRHQLMLDTSNKGAMDNVYNQICRILDSYEIDYVKWDHNRTVANNYSYCHSSEQQGSVIYDMTKGSYLLMDRLIKRYPNIFFQGCASGGGRFDLGILYYSPEIWASDETDPIQRLRIQYGTSFLYPLSTMGAHISANPVTSYEAKADVALFGSYGYEFDPRKLTENETKQIGKVTAIYKKFHTSVIQNGDLYRLLNPFETNYMSMMSVSKDKSKALVLFANYLKEPAFYRFLKLNGLDSQKSYSNDYDNSIHTGEYYMKLGINLSRWLNEFTVILITLEEKNN